MTPGVVYLIHGWVDYDSCHEGSDYPHYVSRHTEWVEGLYADRQLADDICAKLQERKSSAGNNAPCWTHGIASFGVREHMVRL
jgi:hypothetical protein